MSLIKEDFEKLDLFNLLINICSYGHNKDDVVLKKYTKWNIEIAAALWQKNFKNFPVTTTITSLI